MEEGIVYAFLGLVGLVHLTPLLGARAYRREEARARHLWQRFSRPAEALDRSVYRSGGAVFMRPLERAPGVVRLAAASCLGMSAALVPGLAWGLLAMGGLLTAILAVPALALAVWLWRVGLKLLRAQPVTTRSVAGGAALSISFHALVLLGFAALLGVGDLRMVAMTLFVASYALLSLAQLALVAFAAREVGRHSAEVLVPSVSVSVPNALSSALPAGLRQLVERRRARQLHATGLAVD